MEKKIKNDFFKYAYNNGMIDKKEFKNSINNYKFNNQNKIINYIGNLIKITFQQNKKNINFNISNLFIR